MNVEVILDFENKFRKGLRGIYNPVWDESKEYENFQGNAKHKMGN